MSLEPNKAIRGEIVVAVVGEMNAGAIEGIAQDLIDTAFLMKSCWDLVDISFFFEGDSNHPVRIQLGLGCQVFILPEDAVSEFGSSLVLALERRGALDWVVIGDAEKIYGLRKRGA